MIVCFKHSIIKFLPGACPECTPTQSTVNDLKKNVWRLQCEVVRLRRIVASTPRKVKL